MYYTYIDLVDLGGKKCIKNSVNFLEWQEAGEQRTNQDESPKSPVSNQIHLPMSSRKQKSHSTVTGEECFPPICLGVRKAIPPVQVKELPGLSWWTGWPPDHLAPWHQRPKSFFLKRVRWFSISDQQFCQIQLWPEIQSVRSMDMKRPARASPNFEMQQNRRKYWLQLRPSPGTKDLQLCYLNLYIFMYFIFFLNLP